MLLHWPRITLFSFKQVEAIVFSVPLEAIALRNLEHVRHKVANVLH